MEFYYQRTYRGPVKMAIFDWAGTTVDFGCFAPSVVFIEVFKRQGIDITIKEARGPMGSPKRDHIKQITQMESVAERWQEVHGRPCQEEDIDEMYKEFIPLQVQCIADYAGLVPGTLEVIADLRQRAIKIGGTTGYSHEMMEVLQKEAKKLGFEPDVSVCATDVKSGRPHPWMCIKAAMDLQVYPMEACVKIGDTLPDIYEGLNAGMWSIGVVMTGNEIGMTEEEIKSANPEDLNRKRERAYQKMAQAGAHYVVDSIENVPALIDEINQRLARGERP